MTVTMKRQPWYLRIWMRIYPPARRAHDERMRRMMRYLIEHPEIELDIAP